MDEPLSSDGIRASDCQTHEFSIGADSGVCPSCVTELVRGLRSANERADRAEAGLAAAQEALKGLADLARAARSQGAAPDYDGEAIRDNLWALVHAVLARGGGQQEK